MRPNELTPHFDLEEFFCNDGTPVPDELVVNVVELAKNLEILRIAWNRPITILSGYRTPAWNKLKKGKKDSQHLRAAAADIIVSKVPPDDVADLIDQMMGAGSLKRGGLGRYDNFTHYDIRGTLARWDERTKR